MTRQYNRRETATQTPESKTDETPETGEPVVSDDKPETTEDVKGGDSSNDAPAAGSEKADTKAKPKKAKTRAQLAREEAEESRAEQDAVAVASAPTFAVTFPTGISIHFPDDNEVEVTMSGGEKVWIDVEGGFVHLPIEARWKPRTLDQLAEFASLAGLGYVKQVAFS